MLAGRYRVVRHVGSGGMASVYLAEDDVLKRRVAVKSVMAEERSERGRRIRREARLGAGLRHPHLVTIYDVLADEDALLLVMEYVEGETLADLVKRGPLPPDRALAVLKPLADALDHAHDAGVVHRDVKPANVLVGAGGIIKLSDLGIATSADVTQITRTGGTLGTAAYMAPEQFEPGAVTKAVDVYALGAVAFEVLAGKRAFDDVTPPQLFARLREETPPPDLRKARPDLPEAAAAAIARGMASRPENRPASARELVNELAAALGEPEPTSAQVALPDAASLPDPTQTMEPVKPREERAAPPDPEPRPPEPAPPPKKEPAPKRPASGDGRGARRVLIPLAALAFLGLVAAIVVLSVGGDDDEPASRSAGETRTQETKPAQTQTQPARTTPGSGPASGSPDAAVRAFYERAAKDDFDGSWEIAGPGLRATFGNSKGQLRGTLGTLERIRFRRLNVTEQTSTTATVAISTVATHTNRVDRCNGTFSAIRDPERGWLADDFNVQCA